MFPFESLCRRCDRVKPDCHSVRDEQVPPPFDPDLPWTAETNRQAAKARGLVYDRKKKVYIDPDGCPILDGFGQPLG